MTDADFELIESLIGFRPIRYADEFELQELIYRRLASLGDELKREFVLTEADRLDFFWEPKGIVIEVKIKGSPGALCRQIDRYSRHELVRGIIIVRHRDPFLPNPFNDKPLRCLQIWPYIL